MRALLAILGVLSLAACATFNVAPAPHARVIDYLNDDVADLLIAFDLPYGLNPVDGASTASFVATLADKSERHVTATLIRAEADDVAGELPPPAPARVYFLLGFSDKDKAAIREVQAWARSRPPGSAMLALGVAPGLCSSGNIDPARATISVRIGLAGETGLAPLIEGQKLSTTLAGKPLEPCR